MRSILAALFFLFLGVSDIFADDAVINFPDGSKACVFEGASATPSRYTLNVSGCYLGSQAQTPPPPPNVSGDPGSGVWVSPSGVIVFDLSSTSNRTFVPGCIKGEDWLRTDCEWQDSMGSKVYAARIRIPQSSAKNYKFDRAEAGEFGSWSVRGALSSIPGDFQSGSPACVFGGSDNRVDVVDTVRQAAMDASEFCFDFPPEIGASQPSCSAGPPSCVVSADTLYYLSFTVDGGCPGTCRIQVTH